MQECFSGVPKHVVLYDSMPLITMATDLSRDIVVKCLPVQWNIEIKWHRRQYPQENLFRKLKKTKKKQQQQKLKEFSTRQKLLLVSLTLTGTEG